MTTSTTEDGREHGRKRGRCLGSASQPASHLPARHRRSRTYRLKERQKAPRQNVDEEKQVKLRYKS